MTLKRICDTCGAEMERSTIRLTFKDTIQQQTRRGAIVSKTVTRTLDFCDKKCFNKFVDLWNEVRGPEGEE